MAGTSINDSSPVSPDPLGQLTDRMVETLLALLDAPAPYKQRAAGPYLRAVSDWAAEILNRASSQSSGSVMVIYEDMQAQLQDIRARLETLEQLRAKAVGDGDV